jgi:putative ABC transport system permease protein
MFLIYLRRELRRRLRQAVLVSLGLAVGVGLVVTVTAASDGVKNAQGTVLHSLYGVGTDVTVTRAAATGSGEPPGFQIRQQVKASLDHGQATAGTHFSKNLLTSSASGLGPLGSSSMTRIARLPGVSAVGGALGLTDLKVSGTIASPAARAAGGGAGQTSINTSSFSVLGADVSASRVGPLSSAKLTAGRTFTGSDAGASVALVDANYAAQNKLKPGSTVTVGDGGGDGTRFTVIGVVRGPPGATPADVYIPLARAQALGTAPQGGASLTGKINTIYVGASSAADIPAVRREISTLLPSATVSTSSDLAGEVTGSLASTASLASDLGRWLEAAALLAAFLLASLLTMTAVARRVREFGTLKAQGWRTRRIVAQVMGETITMGIAGALVGVGLGIGGAALVAHLAPPLSATVGQPLGSAAPAAAHRPAASVLHSLNASAVPTLSVHLTAPVTVGIVVAAVLLALAGGLIAGAFGGWRAGRLRPAAALGRIE